MSEEKSRETNTLRTSLYSLLSFNNPASHLSYSPIFNFLYFQYFPNGILNMVFPSPLIQCSANSFLIWEFYQICCLKGTHPPRHPYAPCSETSTLHDFWCGPLCCLFLWVHLSSVTFAKFFLLCPPYPELCMIKRECLLKKEKENGNYVKW